MDDGVWILLVILAGLVALGAALLHVRQAGGGAQVATWIVLSILALTCEFVIAFVGVHVLLFALGDGAALVGLVISAVVLAVTPVVLAVILARRARHSTAGG